VNTTRSFRLLTLLGMCVAAVAGAALGTFVDLGVRP
jgi:uncharacterized membrane protein